MKTVLHLKFEPSYPGWRAEVHFRKDNITYLLASYGTSEQQAVELLHMKWKDFQTNKPSAGPWIKTVEVDW